MKTNNNNTQNEKISKVGILRNNGKFIANRPDDMLVKIHRGNKVDELLVGELFTVGVSVYGISYQLAYDIFMRANKRIIKDKEVVSC